MRMICKAGLRHLLLLIIGAGLLAYSLTQANAAERRVALVIGNAAYQSVSPLANSANDARLMAKTLTDLGFTLVAGGALLNLDKPAMERAIQDFGHQIVGADVGLFYYAGHGVQVRGSNYLVPVTANPSRETDVDFQMVDAQLILRQMGESQAKLNIVLLDACRNNPFAVSGLRAAGGGLAQMGAPEGTIISYATQPGAVATDGSDGDSPYTRSLVASMREPGRSVFDVFNNVGLMVKASTHGNQQPWLSSSPLQGQFYFVPPTSGVGAPPPSPPQPLALASLPPPPRVGDNRFDGVYFGRMTPITHCQHTNFDVQYYVSKGKFLWTFNDNGLREQSMVTLDENGTFSASVGPATLTGNIEGDKMKIRFVKERCQEQAELIRKP